ncbi:hypothetical protein ACQP1G_25790 [Nocardia sp. CA-107356]|uniref:hypothetical protein n=1 Tax=Nocardia sp. CA-107356 TaxID=3239972 RepID=UPI003D8CCA2D
MPTGMGDSKALPGGTHHPKVEFGRWECLEFSVILNGDTADIRTQCGRKCQSGAGYDGQRDGGVQLGGDSPQIPAVLDAIEVLNPTVADRECELVGSWPTMPIPVAAYSSRRNRGWLQPTRHRGNHPGSDGPGHAPSQPQPHRRAATII